MSYGTIIAVVVVVIAIWLYMQLAKCQNALKDCQDTVKEYKDYLDDWKKWADAYEDWVKRNCACPNPDSDPPSRPPFP